MFEKVFSLLNTLRARKRDDVEVAFEENYDLCEELQNGEAVETEVEEDSSIEELEDKKEDDLALEISISKCEELVEEQARAEEYREGCSIPMGIPVYSPRKGNELIGYVADFDFKKKKIYLKDARSDSSELLKYQYPLAFKEKWLSVDEKWNGAVVSDIIWFDIEERRNANARKTSTTPTHKRSNNATSKAVAINHGRIQIHSHKTEDIHSFPSPKKKEGKIVYDGLERIPLATCSIPDGSRAFNANRKRMEKISYDNIKGEIKYDCYGTILIYKYPEDFINGKVEIEKKYRNALEKDKCRYMTSENILPKMPIQNVPLETVELTINSKVFCSVNCGTCFCCRRQTKKKTAKVQMINYTGDTVKVELTSGYCEECDCFNISLSDYEWLNEKNVFVCHMPPSLEDETPEGQLREVSIAKAHGYSVGGERTPEQREMALKLIMDNKVLNRARVEFFLKWLIDRKRNQQEFSASVKKWKEDLKYVQSMNRRM